jgi:G3E family GTPase
MATPILLITGFLGAGKTTLINRLLAEPQGRKLAAVVNDFGAIDIDAALLASVADGVVSLKNGCICCSLQGDLLRTLSMILRRAPAPDGIVIETSGVSNPAEIVRALLDPVIFRDAALDAVICVTDARALADQTDLVGDALWKSQLDAADYVALSKTDLVSQTERDRVRDALRRHKPDRLITDMVDGRIPAELLFSSDLHRPSAGRAPKSMMAMPAFQTVSWTSRFPLIMARFQNVIGQLAPTLVRAKGIVEFAGRPGQTMLFQLVGTRATISPAPQGVSQAEAVRLVFIARSGTLDEAGLAASLERCCAERAQE